MMEEVRSYTTRSPEETEALGEALSRELSAGDIVALVGELGGGKTRFVRGMATGLGSRGFVKSPSFTIINIYEGGRLPLYHIDLYRIAGAAELEGAGLDEFIYGGGVSAVEWADRTPSLVSGARAVVSFKAVSEHDREIEIRIKVAGKG